MQRLCAQVPDLLRPEALPLQTLRLPPGFAISLYATGVPQARSLTRSPAGVVYVGTRQGDTARALLDCDGDQRADRLWTIARGLDQPNGVVFHDGALYVAEAERILRFANVEATAEATGETTVRGPRRPQVLFSGFPANLTHSWKILRLGPDGWLYVPVGADCNVCRGWSPLQAAIHRLRLDGSGLEAIAHGVRNTMGFDWHPQTRELWFTDNGRDSMGDDLPPDELNRLARVGQHFGFPACHGDGIPDPRHNGGQDCAATTAPAQALGPHVAALGMRFYTGTQFPPAYRGQIFIAEHGSWNRSQPIGYRVTLVRLEGNRAVSYQPFAQGWLQGRQHWGRPVDLLVMPDGALLVSDDLAGAVYRIHYQAP